MRSCFARRFPNVRVIMAHLTGCGVRGVLAARDCDNLLVDTSGAAPEAGIVAYAVEKLGVERVLYGSDAPIPRFRRGDRTHHGCGVGPRRGTSHPSRKRPRTPAPAS
jgi:predicted TIM-barrel fold metal-dependent hydrolase